MLCRVQRARKFCAEFHLVDRGNCPGRVAAWGAAARSLLRKVRSRRPANPLAQYVDLTMRPRPEWRTIAAVASGGKHRRRRHEARTPACEATAADRRARAVGRRGAAPATGDPAGRSRVRSGCRGRSRRARCGGNVESVVERRWRWARIEGPTIGSGNSGSGSGSSGSASGGSESRSGSSGSGSDTQPRARPRGRVRHRERPRRRHRVRSAARCRWSRAVSARRRARSRGAGSAAAGRGSGSTASTRPSSPRGASTASRPPCSRA